MIKLKKQFIDDHSLLDNLAVDDHTQYALLAGRAGGQTLIGGTASGENLILQSTSHATKGKILFGTSAYDEVNNRLGIGETAPGAQLQVNAVTASVIAQIIKGATSQSANLSEWRNSTGTVLTRVSPTGIISSGSGVTDILKLQGTSGNGTATSPAIQYLVGNNGATIAGTFLNNGNFGLDTVAPSEILSFGNAQARKIWIETTDYNTVGRELTVSAGSTINTDPSDGTFNSLNQTVRQWYGVASAPNGDIYACVYNGDIYMQTGGTGDFIALSQTTRAWQVIAAAPNGDVYCADAGRDIYKQTGGTGNFIALGQTNRNWKGLTVNPITGDVYACVQNGDIYMQTAGAGNFNALSQTARNYWGMAVNPLTGDVYVGVYGGDIYMQTGGTGTFNALGQTNRAWFGLGSDPSGNIYATVDGINIFKQTDGSGAFVSLNQTARQWYGIAGAPNGDVYATVWNSGNIYRLNALSGGTADLAGGDLILSSGQGKGTGTSTVYIKTGTTLTTGTSLQTLSNKVAVYGNGNTHLLLDNQKLLFGAGQDASILYDGTDLHIDSALVGTGIISLDSDTKPVGRLIVPMGEINYFDTTGTAITISTQSDGSSNMVLVNPTTALSSGEYEFDNGGGNTGRLRYIGETTKMFHIACTISFSPATANDEFVIGIAKNGTVISQSKVINMARGIGETSSTALHIMAELATDDYLELYVGNLSTTGNFTIKTIAMFAMGL